MRKADFHTHTTFSDGHNSIHEVLEAAARASIEVLAITDHFDPNDYRPAIAGLTEPALLDHFRAIREAARNYDLQVLCGVETTPLPDGSLALSPGAITQCEVIITSCHYLPYDGELKPGEFFNDRYWSVYKECMLAMADGAGHILGHCEDYLPIERLIHGLATTYTQRRTICLEIVNRYLDRPYIEKLAANLSRSGKMCELHCATQTPREWVARLLATKGVRFSPGSDAHAADQVGKTEWAYHFADSVNGNLCSEKKDFYGQR
jgi:histidinol phosphatase-like PHP family hydrolase